MKKRVRAAELSFDNYASQFVKDITSVQANSLEPHQRAGSSSPFLIPRPYHAQRDDRATGHHWLACRPVVITKEGGSRFVMCSTSLKLLADRRPTNCARSIFSLRRNIFCL
jgi:hypothetical protein